MKVLFLFPYPPGESPSQRFRFEQYLPILDKEGIHYSLEPFWDAETWRILYQPGKKFNKAVGFLKGILRRVRAIPMLATVDYVFVHRECAPVGPPLFEWLMSVILRKKIIYDFDDAIWLPNTSKENHAVSILKWHSKVDFICRWSYKVSCGNLFLCDYAYRYNRNVVLNPTTIDTEAVHNPDLHIVRKKAQQIVIGWTGSHSTLKYLEAAEAILQRIEDQYPNVRFTVIADKPPALSLKRMTFVPWKLDTEIQDLAAFDIGIMPLSNDKWSQGKCGFKLLQYMAMKIPAVASPVGVNEYIIDQGINGFLATTPDEWVHYVGLLIEDQAQRELIGSRGRDKVLRDYSVRSNASNFLSLFT